MSIESYERGSDFLSILTQSQRKQGLASLFHFILGPLTDRIALVIKRERRGRNVLEEGALGGRDFRIDSPLSDPVKKFLAAGVPREETRPKGAGGEKLSKLWRCPSGDYRFPYRARSSPFGALYAGPYGGKAYINSALTALRRSFVPICSTRRTQDDLAQSIDWTGWQGERRRGKMGVEDGEATLFSPSLSVSLFHCQFPLRIDLCPALRRSIKSCLLASFSFLSTFFRVFTIVFCLLLTSRGAEANGSRVVMECVDKFAQRKQIKL